MKHALRSLLRTPGFTIVAIVTLALGIGMNTAMFSMLNTFLLRPLRYPDSARLFRLDHPTPRQPFGDHSPANFLDLARASTDIAELAAYRYWGFTLSEDNRPADAPFAARVTANYFAVLGLEPQLGRSFRSEEDAPGRNNVLVISHNYWQSRFGGDPGIIGRTVRIDGQPSEIVGVLPAADDALRITGPIQLYRPMGLADNESSNRAEASMSVIGRYRDGVAPGAAAAQFDAIARRLAADHSAENADLALSERTLQSTTLTGPYRTITFLLVGLSGFVLLIACGNLANLLLARAIARARESSIRAALGASPWYLVKPLAAECCLLAAAGGLAALLVAAWTAAWLAQQFGNPDNPIVFSLDARVLGFAVAASFVTTLLFGVAPAWWAARVRLNDSLKSGARGATGSRSQHRYRAILIVVQFALALVLLAGAGLFLRGVQRLARIDSGWDPTGVITGSVNLASARYNATAPLVAFHEQLRERLLAVPGVANVAVGFEEPLYNAPSQRKYVVEGREPPKPGQEPVAFTNGVSASYFDTFGIRVLRGRAFDRTDTHTSRPVVVINETMARALFPNTDPLGRRLGVAGDSVQWAEIVGVVADTRAQDVSPSPIVFQVYKPYPQEAWQYVTIAVRASDPAKVPSLLEPIRRAVAALDSDQPVLNLQPESSRLVRNVGFLRTINQLLLLFAGLGLFLAALGIYGVITRVVAQRTGEIGIRMALGAQVRDIFQLVLGGSLRLALLGTAVGIAGALALARTISSSLPAFHSDNPAPIALASAVLIAVALLACWLPARRATRVNPVEALRAE